jgi:hypothetical protein
MNSKNYKEPEDGGQYGGRPAKPDSGRNVDKDRSDSGSDSSSSSSSSLSSL